MPMPGLIEGLAAGVEKGLGAYQIARKGRLEEDRLKREQMVQDAKLSAEGFEQSPDGTLAPGEALKQKLAFERALYDANDPMALQSAQIGKQTAGLIGVEYDPTGMSMAQQERIGKTMEPYARIKAQQEALRAKREAGSKNPKQEKDERERTVPGYGLALTKKDAEQMKTAVETRDRLRSSLLAIADLRKKHGNEMFPTKARTKAKSLATQAQLDLKELSKLGALTGPDFGLLQSLVSSDPLAVSIPGQVESKIEEALSGVERNFEASLKSKGLIKTPSAKSGLIKDPEEMTDEELLEELGQ